MRAAQPESKEGDSAEKKTQPVQGTLHPRSRIRAGGPWYGSGFIFGEALVRMRAR